MGAPASLIALTPTLGLSNRSLVIGLDSVSVESAMTRNSTGLAGSTTYKSATRELSSPTGAFFYVDTALLYSRLDASLRPMLLMSAAFMPAISDYLDVTKLPRPEIVAKHRTPIVSSQPYDRGGYVTESGGPLTVSQAAAGCG